MKLVLDHHYSPALARALREAGHDVVAALERSWHRVGDEQLLTLSADEQRALLTADVKDFVPIARAWAEQGNAHAGVLLATQRSVPRTLSGMGEAVQVITAFLDAHPDVNACRDRVHWL